MIAIALPQRPQDGCRALWESILRRKDVHALFGFDAPPTNRDDVLRHLSSWLADPGPTVTDALRAPLKAMADVFGAGDADGRTCGDMEMDAALEGIVRSLGMDPRAYALLTAFHPFEEVSLAGTTFRPSMGDNMATGTYHVSAIVDLGGRNEISTESGRIEIEAELPDTVIEAAPGRPVTDLVDHPLIRNLGLVVHDLHLIGFGTRIVYRNTPSRPIARIPGLRR
jgi:hypothetical protein